MKYQEFNLADRWLITQSGDEGFSWQRHPEGDPGDGLTFYPTGRCRIANNVLILGCQRAMLMCFEPDSLERFPEMLSQQPKWIGTKYYVEITNCGQASPYYCETGERVPDEEAPEIMTKLVFLKSAN